MAPTLVSSGPIVKASIRAAKNSNCSCQLSGFPLGGLLSRMLPELSIMRQMSKGVSQVGIAVKSKIYKSL